MIFLGISINLKPNYQNDQEVALEQIQKEAYWHFPKVFLATEANSKIINLIRSRLLRNNLGLKAISIITEIIMHYLIFKTMSSIHSKKCLSILKQGCSKEVDRDITIKLEDKASSFAGISLFKEFLIYEITKWTSKGLLKAIYAQQNPFGDNAEQIENISKSLAWATTVVAILSMMEKHSTECSDLAEKYMKLCNREAVTDSDEQ